MAITNLHKTTYMKNIVFIALILLSACKKEAPEQMIPPEGFQGTAGGTLDGNVNGTVGATTPIAPGNLQTRWAPITFTWNKATGATSYDVEAFSDLPKGTAILIATVQTTSVTSLKFKEPSNGWAGKEIKWHVRGRNGSDVGQWSGYATFKLVMP